MRDCKPTQHKILSSSLVHQVICIPSSSPSYRHRAFLINLKALRLGPIRLCLDPHRLDPEHLDYRWMTLPTLQKSKGTSHSPDPEFGVFG